ncbi:DGQHR domain-containing protein [Bacillus infantis]|uniref:DGQHR domain-containing protein n=1 Tax=Bacillus infantis TaxID=324767 RepID=A0A5D4RK16_9BACI|nr:DGQHR domain-containing protein [Bacillus infantis]TYS51149.1 DGQHR domain-containing protein [Bacillus infantis]
MIKIPLQKVVQKGKTFYVMVADPRTIVGLLPKVEAGSSQETQRPWLKKKVIEISSYVAGKLKIDANYRALGLIPNNPILVINHPLEIKKETVEVKNGDITEEKDMYYIMIPTELEDGSIYEGSIDALDGQHRLRSFDPEFRDPKFSDHTPYQMIFSVFDDLSKNERKEIFMITNEKQDKVSTNLIRLLKKALGLLNEEEEKVFDITEGINVEPFSVLKGRIMFGSDKVLKGYKDTQLSKILSRSGTIDSFETYGIDNTEKKVKVISNYLKAWEEIFDVSYQDPGKDTLTKISGVRYVLYLFPSIFEILMKNQKPATKDNFKEIILKLPQATGIDNVFENPNTSLAFRGEGATVKLSKDHGKDLLTHINSENTNFDPTDGI